jgi:uncharacterized protein YkwD
VNNLLILAVVASTLTAAPSVRSHAPRPPTSISASQVTEETIPIAFVNAHRPAPIAFETRMLTFDLNVERAKRGVPALTRDADLDRIAYAKGVDMAAHSYFGHTDPAGITFQDRMRAAHWTTEYVAENIAFDRNEKAANLAFVNSPGHYANMIDPNERRVGIAVITVGRGETFYVQVFSGV